MADNINVNCDSLSRNADRLNTVKRRIQALEIDVKKLYWHTGNFTLWELSNDKFDVGCKAIKKSISAINKASSDFEKTTRSVKSGGLKLDGLDSLKYAGQSSIKRIMIAYDSAELLSYIGNAVKVCADKVNTVCTDLLTSYYSQGTVYKIVQYGKATLRFAKGVKKILTGVAAVGATGGLSAPFAIATIVSGVNDVFNSVVDAVYVYTEDYDKVGSTNLLKDALVSAGKTVGGALGNEKIGNIVGNIAYYGIDISTSIATIHSKNYMDALKQVKTTKQPELLAELKEIAHLDIADIRVDRYGLKLMSYAYSETANAVSNIKLIAEGVGSCAKVVSDAQKAISEITDVDSGFMDAIRDTEKMRKNIGKAVEINYKVHSAFSSVVNRIILN